MAVSTNEVLNEMKENFNYVFDKYKYKYKEKTTFQGIETTPSLLDIQPGQYNYDKISAFELKRKKLRKIITN